MFEKSAILIKKEFISIEGLYELLKKFIDKSEEHDK